MTLKRHAFCVAIVLTFILNYSCRSEVGLDTITRQIRCQGNAVWVVDDLHYSQGIAGIQGDLWDIYNDIKKNGSSSTNIEKLTSELLEKEDLAIQMQVASYTNGYVDLHLVSIVRTSKNPARLHLVASMGGSTINERTWLEHPEQIGHMDYLGGRIDGFLTSALQTVIW